jgi:hypothetical protein
LYNTRSLTKQLPAAVAALCVVLLLSAYLELLGWRILQPEISLSEVWGRSYLRGVVQTATGAAVLGFLLLLCWTITGRSRRWMLLHPVLLWSIGAGIFLLVMAALIMWAP